MTDLSFIEKKPIQKGWSCDSKYCVTAADGTKYLMRITPHEKSASRENMFRMQQKVAELGVPMCRPVAFGTCDEGVYNLQTWIDGQECGRSHSQRVHRRVVYLRMARQKHTPNNSFDSCARHAAGMGTAFSCKSTAEYKNLPGLSGSNGWRPKVHCLYRAEPAFTEKQTAVLSAWRLPYCQYDD